MHCLYEGVHSLMSVELTHVTEEEIVLLVAHIVTKVKSNFSSMIGEIEEGLSVLNVINLAM